MAPILSDEELRDRGGDDVVAYVYELRQQAETHKARADAVAVNAEQTCALIEQKFLSLTTQYAQLENEKHQTLATIERRSGELAQAQSQVHKLELDAIKHGSEVERLSLELNEARKTRRDLLELVEHSNRELDEKKASNTQFLEKIVSLREELSLSEQQVRERDSELARSHAVQARLEQEKELLEKHNTWLNEELDSKVKSLMQERRASADLEAELQSKLLQLEKLNKENQESLRTSTVRVRDLEAKLSHSNEELRCIKEEAIHQENHLSTEITTATKLADLYKESSEEWSKKCADLEGVIKALETHLNQVEADYRDKLEKETERREAAINEASELKEKLEKTGTENRTDAEREGDAMSFPAPPLKLITQSTDEDLAVEMHGGVSYTTVGKTVSGTALAAALLRDGWTLSTMYSKYQEAVDAWRHETYERRNSQALLQRVLHEIELKAEVILDERAEHERMVESYRVMEEKLHFSMADQGTLENTIKDLKADLRKKEREVKGAQKAISDLQTQVAVLLEECGEVKKRFEADDWQPNGDAHSQHMSYLDPDSSVAGIVISEKLVTFKDIRGMVDQNSQLRSLLRNLAEENEQKEAELKEFYSAEVKKRADEAARKVADTLKKYKEKTELIETLQGTLSMYKRLYEEELKSRLISRSNFTSEPLKTSEDDGKDYGRLVLSSKEEIFSLREQLEARIKSLEESLNQARQELTSARIERAKADAEAAVAKEQMLSLSQEAESRRKEMDSALSRNMEFSRTITDYQQRLRESAQKMQAAEELAQNHKMKVAVLEKEKELLALTENRASEEAASLSKKIHRLQASMDSHQSNSDLKESIRAAEIKKLQDDRSQMQKEWAEAKRELEMERRHSRDLVVSRDKTVKEAMDRVDALAKELADAFKAMSAAETRAQVAEARCTELEGSLKNANEKISFAINGGKRFDSANTSGEEMDVEILAKLQQAREELEQAKEDLVAAKGHTEQYKRIAEANEEALKQLEAAHNSYKSDVERMKDFMEADVKKLKDKITSLEETLSKNDTEKAVMAEENAAAIREARQLSSNLQESLSSTVLKLQESDELVQALKQDVDKYHQQWREAQRNYERQVLLQADTIKELTQTEAKLTRLEALEASLQRRAEVAESQLASAQVAWAMEKSTTEASKVDIEKKVEELEEQNKLLLDRLEAEQITAVHQSRKESVEDEDLAHVEEKGDGNLQNVIRFLRRSKETAVTEVSLLQQERLRLQRQLDSALRAAEEAQAALRREQESTRRNIYSDEEFRSLQAQVRELNLLRESNTQLREENRRNFEDARESREKMRLAQMDLEPLQTKLKEKEVELESTAKETEMLQEEIKRWQLRVSQLLEKYKSTDVDDYQRMKKEVDDSHKSLTALKLELESVKEVSEALKKENDEAKSKCEKLQSDLVEKETKVDELEKSAEAVKNELDRFKRHAAFQKRRIDTIIKEKDELAKESENLSKQIEDLKAIAGKRMNMESRQEVARQEASLRQEAAARLEQLQKESENTLKEKETTIKERDARILLLEKTLEKERESLRKEKVSRQKDQKTYVEAAQRQAFEKKKVEVELEALKRSHRGEVNLGVTSDGPPLLETEEKVSGTEPLVVTGTEQEEVMVLPSASTSLLSGPLQVSQPAIANTTESSVQKAPVEDSGIAGEVAQNTTANAVVTVANAVAGSSGVLQSSAGSVGGPVTSGFRPARSNALSGPVGSTKAPLRPPVPVSDQKEREIAQLRREIEERERNAANNASQARKSARRLIRPRIEPAGLQESTQESGETTLEGPGDGPDGDVELPDLGKGPNVGVEAEGVPVKETVPEVDDFVVPGPDSASFQSVPTNGAPASTQPLARKRPAILSSAGIAEGITADTAPPQKKPRPVGTGAEAMEETVALASTSLPDSRVHGEVRPEPQDAYESSGLPGSFKESTPAVSTSLDVEREHPITEIPDVPPQKRLRVTRPEASSHPGHPGTKEVEVQEVDTSAQVADITDVNREPEIPSETKELTVVDPGSPEHRLGPQGDEIENQLTLQSAGLISGDTPVASGEGQTAVDFDLNQSVNTLVDVTTSASVTLEVGAIEIGQDAAADKEAGSIVAGVLRSITTATEAVAVEEVQEAHQVEEGEVILDVMTETTNMETFSEQTFDMAGDQERVGTELDTGFPEVATSVENVADGSTSVDDRSNNEATTGGPDVDGQAGSSEIVGDTALETSVQDTKMAEEKHTEGPLAISHVAAVKSTTIHLAERARERALLRRGGLTSPTAAARGSRTAISRSEGSSNQSNDGARNQPGPGTAGQSDTQEGGPPSGAPNDERENSEVVGE